jgi:hypothetical protein
MTMKKAHVPRALPRLRLMAGACFILALLAPAFHTAAAQDLPRQVRTFIPPDQVVSFVATTPFNQFVQFLNPVLQNATGKILIDPESRTHPIGVSVQGMHYFDALMMVLQVNQLNYRETDRYFFVEPMPPAQTGVQAPGQMAPPPGPGRTTIALPANAGTREIEINAVLFEMNQSLARQIGIDWNVLFGGERAGGSIGGGGVGGGTGGDADSRQPRIFVNTSRLFDRLSDWITGPNQIEGSVLMEFFRLVEQTGVGETIANPSISVQSGQQGRIQIGSDIPVQVRDFAGNTITQFVSTGIIINVVPTLIRDQVDEDSPELEFIHLDVQVERSSGRPFGAGIAIDRSTANTQAVLLDREQTIIGGLYSTDFTRTRRGVPVLKDLPPWVFGLRYIFGFEQMQATQRELVIVLQARVVDPLDIRSQRPLPQDMLDRFRQDVEMNFDRFDQMYGRQIRNLRSRSQTTQLR